MYNIAEMLITLIIVAVSAFVVPWLKSKIGEARLSNIVFWVKTAVEAAEQLICKDDDNTGVMRKEFVREFLMRIGIQLTADELDKLIESSVYELNMEVKNANI